MKSQIYSFSFVVVALSHNWTSYSLRDMALEWQINQAENKVSC